MKKTVEKLSNNTERAARKAVLEELFYDMNSSRLDIYKVNFVRGIFFGFGSVVGGSILVVISVILLTTLVDLPGGIGDFIQRILDAMNTPR